MSRIVVLIFGLLPSLAHGQVGFQPSPVVQTHAETELLLEKAYKQELSRIEDLKGKQAEFVRKSFQSRKQLLLEMLESGDFIFQSPLYSYIDSLFRIIISANPEISSSSVILVSRSGIPNAFSTGDGFTVIHAGLLHRLENEAELAFVLCHELSHQQKDHIHQHIRKSAQIYTDPQRKKAIAKILKSEYKVKSQLEGLVMPGMMASMRHKRSDEVQADSLGVIFLQNAGFPQQAAFSALKQLDKADKDMDDYMSKLNHFFDRWVHTTYNLWEEAERGSSLGVFENDIYEIPDSLKTHPDYVQRVAHLTEYFGNGPTDTAQDPDNRFSKSQEIAELEMIENYIQIGNLGKALYHAIGLYDENSGENYPLDAIGYLFARLSQLKTERMMGVYFDSVSPNYPEGYNRLLSALWELKARDCAAIAYTILREGRKGSDTPLFLSSMALSAHVQQKTDEAVQYAKLYLKEYPKGNFAVQMNSLIK